MATAITIGERHVDGGYMPSPDCSHADKCYWFEKMGTSSAGCVNRQSMVCPKRQADVFAQHQRTQQSAK